MKQREKGQLPAEETRNNIHIKKRGYTRPLWYGGVVFSVLTGLTVTGVLNFPQIELSRLENVVYAEHGLDIRLEEDEINQLIEESRSETVNPMYTQTNQAAGTKEDPNAYIKSLVSQYRGEDYTNHDEFIELLARYRHIAAERGILPSVMMAQALLESGVHGESGLAKDYRNLFGIKGSYKGQSAQLTTLEDAGVGEYYQIVDGFRSYPSYEESIRDYVSLLTEEPRYRYVTAYRNPGEQLQAIVDAGYATDGYYVIKALGMIQQYDLMKYDTF